MQKTKILKHLLERFTVKRKDRLFVNKRGDAGEKESLEAVAREKKVHVEHPFKLFNLISPQQTDARRGQRIPRGGRQVMTRDKGWMLDAVQEALKEWQEGMGEPGGNSRKMLMERMAASQRMMPIPRIG